MKRIKSLSETAREAAEVGLSYGEYVAGMPPKRQPVRKRPAPEPEQEPVVEAAPDPRLERLRAMAEAGLTAQEMGEELGITASQVYRLMRREEIHICRKARARRHGDEPERWPFIRRMREDGRSIREIAELLEMSAPGVRYAMRAMGLPPGEERGSEAKQARMARVREMLEQGVSVVDMALRLGASRNTVYKDIREIREAKR